MSLTVIRGRPGPITEAERMEKMLEIAAIAAKYSIPLRVYADIEHMRWGLADEELGRKVREEMLNLRVFPACFSQ